MNLTIFNELDFLPALRDFFKALQVPVNAVTNAPIPAREILENSYKDNESFRLIDDVYFLGLVDDAAFRGNQSLEIDQIKSDYDGILIFGVTLNNRDHGQLPTRFLGRASLSHLAEISRAFNREFCYTPVVIIFKYGEYLAFANTERLKYKDNREGEKAGKVTLLRDIDIKQPHSGHQRILAELAIPKQGKDRVDSFAKTNLEAQKENLERAFARNGLDYGRKLFLIQNCIYGVDIQAIAVQIAKLRFFISLIIDQQEDQDETNRGILPLPNLETKFVAANSLIGVTEVFHSQNLLMLQSELKADGWRLENTEVLDLLAKLRNAGQPLEEITGKICIGIKTGFNEAFIIDRKVRDKLIAEHSSSTEVIKPFLRGRDIKKWDIEYQDIWIIFTRKGIDIKKYPAIEKHLSQYRNRLTAGVEGGRKAGSYQWYEIQDNVAYWQDFEKAKIIFPDIAPSSRFTYCEEVMYVDMTAFIISTQNLYVLGILNSTIAEYFISLISSSVRGDYLRFKRQYVSQIPIPTATEAEQKAIETLVGYVLHLTAALKDIPSSGKEFMASADDQLMLSYFEQIIDAAVMELYLPEELHAGDKYFMRHLLQENLPNIDKIKGDKIAELRVIFRRLFDRDHPIRTNIYFLGNLDIVKIITGKA